MPEKRLPNTDAHGKDLAGQPVEYNASTGDVLVIGGYEWTVIDSYNHGVKVKRKNQEELLTYRELKKAGVFFAAIN